jgi:hypothetical protein
LQDLRNERSVVGIPNSNPYDHGAIRARRAELRKVPILCEQRGIANDGFIPNLPIGGRQQTYLRDVKRLIACLAQSSSQQRRKLCVN